MPTTRTRPVSINRPAFTLILGLAALSAPQGLTAQSSEPTAAAVEFADTPFSVPSLGLRLWLPVGARIDTTNMMGSGGAFQVMDEDSSWMMRGFSPSSRDKTLTPEAVIDSLSQGLLNPERVAKSLKDEWDVEVAGVNGELLDRQDGLIVSNLEAARFYAQIVRTDGAEVVTGYTAVRLNPGHFVLFEFTSPASEFERTRGVYEAVIAGAEFRDPASASAERAAGLLAATSLLGALNHDDITSMLDEEPTMYRLYVPATTGDPADAREVAYQRVFIREGARGDLDPAKRRSSWNATDKQPGFIVRVDARYLDGERTIDSQSLYFLSQMRDEEHWSIRMTVRNRQNQSQTWVETGTRLDDTIKIKVTQPGLDPIQKQWKTPPEGYLSQVEAYLLPRYFAHFGSPAIFSFYRYNTTTSEISLRRDILSETPGGAGWEIVSRPHENAADETTIIDINGRIISRQLPNGVVMEPIEGERLLALWRAKNLPVD